MMPLNTLAEDSSSEKDNRLQMNTKSIMR